MALKDIWKDKVDKTDDILANDINIIANSVINTEEAFDLHVKGVANNHSAKDIVYSGDYWANKENVEDAINYLGGEIDAHSGTIAGNFKSIQKIETDITAIKKDIEASHNIFANALKGSVTGEAIALKDTSPVEHIMDVKVRKKNLIAYPYRDLPDGIGTMEKYGVTISVDDKGVITLNGTGTNNFAFYLYRTPFPEGVKVGDKITCSKNASDLTQSNGVTFTCNYLKPDGGQMQGLQFAATDFSTTTIKEGAVGFNVYLYIQKDKVFDNLIIKPQVELGDKATGWTPYLAENISTVKLSVEETNTKYAVNEDGTVDGIKSIYPNITLSTDTVGAVIDVEYNRDINKAFAELANAIVALGGTI